MLEVHGDKSKFVQCCSAEEDAIQVAVTLFRWKLRAFQRQKPTLIKLYPIACIQLWNVATTSTETLDLVNVIPPHESLTCIR